MYKTQAKRARETVPTDAEPVPRRTRGGRLVLVRPGGGGRAAVGQVGVDGTVEDRSAWSVRRGVSDSGVRTGRPGQGGRVLGTASRWRSRQFGGPRLEASRVQRLGVVVRALPNG